jgi:hypothetical protein
MRDTRWALAGPWVMANDWIPPMMTQVLSVKAPAKKDSAGEEKAARKCCLCCVKRTRVRRKKRRKRRMLKRKMINAM